MQLATTTNLNQMKTIVLVLLSTFAALATYSESYARQNNQANQQNRHQSEYVGEQNRDIKSLSNEDIEALRNGEGWGLAKAAELNGVPGPAHILDMKFEIALSETQNARIQSIFNEMRKKAIEIGEQLIEKERELNSAFAKGEITISELKNLTTELGAIRGELTFVHLRAHVEAGEVLSEEQIDTYNKLRGYDAISDPCKDIPEGHDPEMWQKHNNCTN